MTRFRRVTCLVLTLVGLATISQPTRAAGQEREDGWILLGAVDEHGSEWITAAKHQASTAESPLPAAGVTITLLEDFEVFVADFKHAVRSRPPADRPITSADRPGVTLKKGGQFVIKEVVIEAPVNGVRGYWVQVQYAKRQ